jgi:tetratricopeptide (TPR) repeat protein
MFAAALQNNSKAILVGEPTAQGPVFFSTPEVLRLPNSHMEFLISSSPTFGSLPWDPRDRLKPDIAAEFTWQDHSSNRDPYLEAAVAYAHHPTSEPTLDRERAELYCGRYRLDPNHAFTIDLTADGLWLEADDFVESSLQFMRTELRQISPTDFLTDVPGLYFRFPRGSSEPASYLTLVWGTRELTARRMEEGEWLPLELIAAGHIAEGVAAIRAEKELFRDSVRNLEDLLNRTGYLHLRQNQLEDAIAIFQLNVELFPESWNVYDSLGEAYLEAGQVSEGLANYRKSLRLNPDNRNARDVLSEYD